MELLRPSWKKKKLQTLNKERVAFLGIPRIKMKYQYLRTLLFLF